MAEPATTVALAALPEDVQEVLSEAIPELKVDLERIARIVEHEDWLELHSQTDGAIVAVEHAAAAVKSVVDRVVRTFSLDALQAIVRKAVLAECYDVLFNLLRVVFRRQLESLQTFCSLISQLSLQELENRVIDPTDYSYAISEGMAEYSRLNLWTTCEEKIACLCAVVKSFSKKEVKSARFALRLTSADTRLSLPEISVMLIYVISHSLQIPLVANLAFIHYFSINTDPYAQGPELRQWEAVLDFLQEHFSRPTAHTASYGVLYTGATHELAVGIVHRWGMHCDAQLAQPERLGTLPHTVRISSAALADTHCCLLTDSGQVYSFGHNRSGELGLGNTKAATSAIHVSALTSIKVAQVACGSGFTLCLSEDGQLWSWGDNRLGQLGIGLPGDRNLPQNVKLPRGLKLSEISCQGSHCVARADGDVYTWGSGENGRLGLGDTKARMTPSRVAALRNIVITTVAAGWAHSLFVANDGRVFGCGKRAYGRLGLSDDRDLLAPTQIVALQSFPIRAVAAGHYHSLFLDDAGTVHSTVLRQDTTEGDLLERIELPTATSIACGAVHCLAVTTEGIFSWGGKGRAGELGYEPGRNAEKQPRRIPYFEGRGLSFRVFAGMGASLAVSMAGRIDATASIPSYPLAKHLRSDSLLRNYNLEAAFEILQQRDLVPAKRKAMLKIVRAAGLAHLDAVKLKGFLRVIRAAYQGQAPLDPLVLLGILESWAEGERKPPLAFYFDGRRSGIQLPTIPRWNATGYSFYAFLRLDYSQTADARIFSYATDDAGGVDFYISNWKLVMQVSTKGKAEVAPSSVLIEPGKWYHIGVTHAFFRLVKSEVRLYVNGEMVFLTQLTFPKAKGGLTGILGNTLDGKAPLAGQLGSPFMSLHVMSPQQASQVHKLKDNLLLPLLPALEAEKNPELKQVLYAAGSIFTLYPLLALPSELTDDLPVEEGDYEEAVVLKPAAAPVCAIPPERTLSLFAQFLSDDIKDEIADERGIDVLAYLLFRRTEHFTPELPGVISKFMLALKPRVDLVSQVMDRILFNFRMWQPADMQTRYAHIAEVTRWIKGDAAFCRREIGIQRLVDALLLYAEKSGLAESERSNFVPAICELITLMMGGNVTDENLSVIRKGIIYNVQDDLIMLNLAQLIYTLLQRHPQQVRRHFAEAGGVLFNFLHLFMSPNEFLRIAGLKLLGLCLQHSSKKSRRQFVAEAQPTLIAHVLGTHGFSTALYKTLMNCMLGNLTPDIFSVQHEMNVFLQVVTPELLPALFQLALDKADEEVVQQLADDMVVLLQSGDFRQILLKQEQWLLELTHVLTKRTTVRVHLVEIYTLMFDHCIVQDRGVKIIRESLGLLYYLASSPETYFHRLFCNTLEFLDRSLAQVPSIPARINMLPELEWKAVNLFELTGLIYEFLAWESIPEPGIADRGEKDLVLCEALFRPLDRFLFAPKFSALRMPTSPYSQQPSSFVLTSLSMQYLTQLHKARSGDKPAPALQRAITRAARFLDVVTDLDANSLNLLALTLMKLIVASLQIEEFVVDWEPNTCVPEMIAVLQRLVTVPGSLVHPPAAAIENLPDFVNWLLGVKSTTEWVDLVAKIDEPSEQDHRIVVAKMAELDPKREDQLERRMRQEVARTNLSVDLKDRAMRHNQTLLNLEIDRLDKESFYETEWNAICARKWGFFRYTLEAQSSPWARPVLVEELDPAEDAGRTRRRLRPRRTFQARRGEAVTREAVLRYAEVSLTLPCVWVHGISRHEGHLLLSATAFKYEPKKASVGAFRIQLDQLMHIYARRYLLETRALEFFLQDHTTLYFVFNNRADAKKFYLACLALPTPATADSHFPKASKLFRKKDRMTELWRKREISNFDYLMHLNMTAGRTYNDLSQYPVFPWIIADWQSSTLQLDDPTTFRDLTKPIGALNPARLVKFQEKYEFMLETEEPHPFLYGSHYSTSGIVLFYLMRVQPFTDHFLAFHGGKFDRPDRLFFSLPEAWNGSLVDSTDVKEMIPELFYMPELLVSDRSFGTRQDGVEVRNVILPPWARSPHEFIVLHRLALESDYVSANLHHWIDLVFGYKQGGTPAREAANIFHWLTYEASLPELQKLEDTQRAAFELQILEFGSCPSVLLNRPHPSKLPKSVSVDGNTVGRRRSSPNILTCFSFDVAREPTEPVFSLDLPQPVVALTSSAFAINCITTSGSCYLLNLFPGEAKQYSIAQLHEVKLGLATVMGKKGRILLAGPENSATLWRAEGPVLLTAHQQPVSTLWLGDDYLLTGSSDTTAFLWATEAAHGKIFDRSRPGEKPLLMLRGHDTPVTALTANPALDLIATGEAGGRCLLHTLSGTFVRTILLPKQGRIEHLSLSDDGFLLVYALSQLWCFSINGQLLATVYERGVSAVATSLCGRSLVVTAGRRIRVWQLPDLGLIWEYRIMSPVVSAIHIRLDQKALVAAVHTRLLVLPFSASIFEKRKAKRRVSKVSPTGSVRFLVPPTEAEPLPVPGPEEEEKERQEKEKAELEKLEKVGGKAEESQGTDGSSQVNEEAEESRDSETSRSEEGENKEAEESFEDDKKEPLPSEKEEKEGESSEAREETDRPET